MKRDSKEAHAHFRVDFHSRRVAASAGVPDMSSDKETKVLCVCYISLYPREIRRFFGMLITFRDRMIATVRRLFSDQ